MTRSGTTVALAAAMALVALALVGSGTASASSTGPVLCIQDYPLCANSTIAGVGRLFPAGITRITLLTGAFASGVNFTGSLSEKCEKSEITTEAESTESGVANTKVMITGLTFTNCSPCTKITVSGLPAKTALAYTSEGNGTLTGSTEVVATASGCPLGVTCVYKAEKFGLEIDGSEAEKTTAKINANEVPLTYVSGSKLACGASVAWTGSYGLVAVKEDLWQNQVLQAEHNRGNIVRVSPEYAI
jgi:hypothetical protein